MGMEGGNNGSLPNEEDCFRGEVLDFQQQQNNEGIERHAEDVHDRAVCACIVWYSVV